jgi:hypothetical protein
MQPAQFRTSVRLDSIALHSNGLSVSYADSVGIDGVCLDPQLETRGS